MSHSRTPPPYHGIPSQNRNVGGVTRHPTSNSFTNELSNVPHYASNTAHSVTNSIGNSVHSVGSAISNGAHNLVSTVSGGIGSVVGGAEKVLLFGVIAVGAIIYLNRDTIKETASTVYTDAKSVYADAKEGVKEGAKYAPLLLV